MSHLIDKIKIPIIARQLTARQKAVLIGARETLSGGYFLPYWYNAHSVSWRTIKILADRGLIYPNYGGQLTKLGIEVRRLLKGWQE